MSRMCLLVVVLLPLFACFCYPAMGTETKIEKPDYDQINKLTHDKTSDFYYPTLFKRYIDNDEDLKTDDYMMLYFGYFFQPGYYETGKSSLYNDSLTSMLNKEQLTKNEWKKVITYINKYFETYPFDLDKLNILFIAYHNLNDEYYSAKYRTKLEMLIKTILATGDGKTSKTAYHVLLKADEIALLSILGYEFGGNQTHTEDQCDYVQIAKNPEGIEGIYFDVKQILANSKKRVTTHGVK